MPAFREHRSGTRPACLCEEHAGRVRYDTRLIVRRSRVRLVGNEPPPATSPSGTPCASCGRSPAPQPGASSAQFGSDALAGVVQLRTHRSLFADASAMSLLLASRMAAPGDFYQQNARLRWMTRSAGLEVAGGLGQLGAGKINTKSGGLPRAQVAWRIVRVRFGEDPAFRG